MSNTRSRYEKHLNVGNRKNTEKRYEVEPLDNVVISHITLGRMIGLFGVILPLILIFATFINGEKILPSISYYYYTTIDISFIGVNFGIAIYLFAYNGESIKEKYLTTIIGVLAILIIIFPTNLYDKDIIKENTSYVKDNFDNFIIPTIRNQDFVGDLHYVFAALFFILLSVLVFVFFVKSEESSTTPSKSRIILYKICGIGMFLSVLLIGLSEVFGWFPNNKNWNFPLTFSFETIALFLFGLAWLVKGEVERMKLFIN